MIVPNPQAVAPTTKEPGRQRRANSPTPFQSIFSFLKSCNNISPPFQNIGYVIKEVLQERGARKGKRDITRKSSNNTS